jgi:hypothetical protein
VRALLRLRRWPLPMSKAALKERSECTRFAPGRSTASKEAGGVRVDETLARFHPMLMVEVLDHQLRARGSSAASLSEFLKAQGYTARRSIDDNVEFEYAAASAANR